jgi:hypothetical protein
MLDFATALRHEASELAFVEKIKAKELKKQLASHVETMVRLQASFDNSSAAAERFATFKPMIDDTYQCPRCWVSQSKRSPLMTQSSESNIDHFKCRECGFEMSHMP